MNQTLTTRKSNKIYRNDNVLTGDTYPIKDYIKTFLGGKWDKESKGWIVDGAQLDRILAMSANAIGLRIDDSAPQQPEQTDHHMGPWRVNGELGAEW